MEKIGNDEFLFFFKSNYHALKYHAGILLGNESDAADVVADVIVNLWERRNNPGIKGSLLSYSMSAVRNLCMNRIKHRMVEKKYRNNFTRKNRTSSLPDTPLAILIKKEFTGAYDRSLQKLPGQTRRVLIMSRLEMRLNHEIASELGISVNTVKTLLQRSLKQVRTDLKDFSDAIE